MSANQPASQTKKAPVRRLLKRDGSFNVERANHRGKPSKDLYHRLLSSPWGETAVLVVAAYFILNLIFAFAYLACGPGALAGSEAQGFLPKLEEAFFFSVQTFSTIGYGKITPSGFLANSLVTLEALVGLLGFALATGILFARFSKPTARVIFSNHAIIAPHDGVKSLMFRIANERLNQIADAQLTVTLSINEFTREGERYRNFYELPLERSRSPIFALSWFVVHPIDEKSPLHGMTDKKLREAEAEIFATLVGLDDTFSSAIHARFSWIPDEILWGKRFSDILSRNEKGTIAINLAGLHDVEDLASEESV